MKASTNIAIQITIVVILLASIFLLTPSEVVSPTIPENGVATSSQVSAAAATTESEPDITAPAIATTSVEIAPQVMPAVAPENPAGPHQVRRIDNPYPTAALTFETVNTMARSALVNIFCSSSRGTIRPISGSGVIIDPRGIILTNAHVAQYVLLAESGRVTLDCQIRAGAPAATKWSAHVLYLPPVWIQEHASDFRKDRPLGTGEHDYALIYAGTSLDGAARPAALPYLAPDTREAVGFTNDPVLAASYPAEFLGSITNNSNLYPVTSITKIERLYTLDTRSIDVISIGSVIGAQSGSSGGAIANAWGRLIGIITTTSDGETTGERTLRGVTLSYIDRDIAAQTGSSLLTFISRDPIDISRSFWSQHGHTLVDTLFEQL